MRPGAIYSATRRTFAGVLCRRVELAFAWTKVAPNTGVCPFEPCRQTSHDSISVILENLGNLNKISVAWLEKAGNMLPGVVYHPGPSTRRAPVHANTKNVPEARRIGDARLVGLSHAWQGLGSASSRLLLVLSATVLPVAM